MLAPVCCQEDLKELATGAFQNMDQAIDAIRRYLELPAAGAADSSRRVPRARAEATPLRIVTVHPMLKSCLSQGTLEALEAVLKDHAELCRASSKVRTATSTTLKSNSAAALLHDLHV